MATINWKVGDIVFDSKQLEAFLVGMIEQTSKTIVFKGRYPIIREFGTIAIELDDSLIAEFTQDYINAGLEHHDALKQATAFVNYLHEKGQPPMPFLRPAADAILAEYANKELGLDDLNNMIGEIANLAMTYFNDDSAKLPFSIPLDISLEPL